MFKAYSAAYWLVKEKVWNPNFSSLANLQTYFGFHEMKNFQYSAQSSIGVIFLVIRSSFDDNLLGKVQRANCFGLLTAKVTDVSFLETKQRTLKHVHCGLKCSEKLHKANAKTTLTLLTTQRKHALCKGERLQLSGF